MVSVNITETRKRMNELIDRALAGEEVNIMRGKKPIARMKPLTAEEIERSDNELQRLAAARELARREA
jgi:antitoxin (DNA-binding transcriptional repressor) of toxin-antitoxin stability system